MKVDFHLSEQHKLMLRILLETKEIRYEHFAELYAFFSKGDPNLGKLIAFLRARMPPPKKEADYSFGIRHVELVSPTLSAYLQTPTPSRSLTAVEREVAGLHYVGLVEVLSSDSKAYGAFEYSSGLDECTVRLTEEGRRIANRVAQGRRLTFRPKPESRNTIFVACAFGKRDLERVYDSALAPACTSLGYEPVRVDLSEPPQTITDAIMSSIANAACLVADLTYARPSVYFEVGFSHGLGVPLLLTCRRDHLRGKDDLLRVHFDLEQFKISFWSVKQKEGLRWDKRMSPAARLGQIVPSRKMGQQKSRGRG